MIDMADIERNMGRDEEALKLDGETLDLEQRVLGPDQPETAVTRYSLACILARRGSTEEALALLRQAVDHGLQPRMDLEIEKAPCSIRCTAIPVLRPWSPTPKSVPLRDKEISPRTAIGTFPFFDDDEYDSAYTKGYVFGPQDDSDESSVAHLAPQHRLAAVQRLILGSYRVN
jgi:hypothetical protein